MTETTLVEPSPPKEAMNRALADMRLAVVCPMANEKDSALPFVTAVLKEAAVFKDVRLFAVLDKVSKDGTLELLREFAKEEPRLKVVWAPENRSVVDAYLRGYREALASGFEWILEIDAGFSHQPEDLRNFFGPMQEGYDCIFGNRFMKGGSMKECSLTRHITSRGGTLLTNLLLGTKLSDMTSGFEMFQRHALEKILDKGIRSRGHFFQTEIKVFAHSMRIAEVPIQYRSASDSVNSNVVKDAFSRLYDLFRERLKGNLYNA